MKFSFVLAVSAGAVSALQAQMQTPTDGDWSARLVELKNTKQSEYMIRVGDIDNLGFGWEENYDPFSGKSTFIHDFPWEYDPKEIKGMDCILLSSSVGKKEPPCSGDGYSSSLAYDKQSRRPQVLELPLKSLKGASIQSAILQLFVDDFQAPNFCAKYQFSLNGKRFTDGERILNSLDQSGPIGKMVSIRLTGEALAALSASDKLSIFIDDPTTGAADGFAIDFIKLLVNPNESVLATCKGAGYVFDAETLEPIAGATVELRGKGTLKTNAEGYFEFSGLIPGLNPVEVFASEYLPGLGTMEAMNDGLDPVRILLSKGNKTVTYKGKSLQAGDAVVIENLQFDRSSFALSAESKAELDKMAAFLKANPDLQIELSGHTSSEGSRSDNIALSRDRVEACKAYLVQKGIDSGRLLTVGHGPDRPIAPNDSETNKAKNRRVEMRVLNL